MICYALRGHDRSGIILWAHGREDFTTMAVLLAWARARLGPDRTWYAFPGTPATATGIEGLPVRHRPATARVLASTGFAPIATRTWWHRPLTTTQPAPAASPLATVSPAREADGWRLILTGTDGTPIGEALLEMFGRRTAHLHRLTIHQGHRSHGPGSRLLAQCLTHAAHHGATHITTTTDTTDPHDPAHRLLTSAGFTPADTLTVHQRPGAASATGAPLSGFWP